MTWWREAMLDALAVLLPVECAGCGAPDRGLCTACRGALAARPRRFTLSGVPTTAALDYDGAARRAILALKEHGRTDIARELARPLVDVLEATARQTGAAALCSLPRSRAGWRRRGFEPVPLLLGAAGLRAARELRWSRTSRDQKHLSIDERAANRDHTLTAVRDLTGMRFIVVDDVVTTGATLIEAIRALRAGGAEVAAAVALAHTPRLVLNPVSQ